LLPPTTLSFVLVQSAPSLTTTTELLFMNRWHSVKPFLVILTIAIHDKQRTTSQGYAHYERKRWGNPQAQHSAPELDAVPKRFPSAKGRTLYSRISLRNRPRTSHAPDDLPERERRWSTSSLPVFRACGKPLPVFRLLMVPAMRRLNYRGRRPRLEGSTRQSRTHGHHPGN
jgi:hypothetical protein